MNPKRNRKRGLENHVGPATVSFGEGMDELVLGKLSKSISRSVENCVSGETSAGVMFSGGIDSTLVAFLSKKFARAKLYTIGVEGSQDLEWAGKIASEIGGDLRVRVLSEGEVLHVYSEVKELLKTEHLLSIELGMAVLLCSRMAKEEGVRRILSGHGADELFAGYSKYGIGFAGQKDVGAMMDEDLKLAIGKDVRESEMIAAGEGIGVGFPFLSKEVVGLAQSIPISEHFKGEERKPVLREIAKILGVPESARTRPKKAMQYGSGIHKILDRKFGKGARPKLKRGERPTKS